MVLVLDVIVFRQNPVLTRLNKIIGQIHNQVSTGNPEQQFPDHNILATLIFLHRFQTAPVRVVKWALDIPRHHLSGWHQCTH